MDKERFKQKNYDYYDKVDESLINTEEYQQRFVNKPSIEYIKQDLLKNLSLRDQDLKWEKATSNSGFKRIKIKAIRPVVRTKKSKQKRELKETKNMQNTLRTPLKPQKLQKVQSLGLLSRSMASEPDMLAEPTYSNYADIKREIFENESQDYGRPNISINHSRSNSKANSKASWLNSNKHHKRSKTWLQIYSKNCSESKLRHYLKLKSSNMKTLPNMMTSHHNSMSRKQLNPYKKMIIEEEDDKTGPPISNMKYIHSTRHPVDAISVQNEHLNITNPVI